MMKRIGALFLCCCMFLCLLCSCTGNQMQTGKRIEQEGLGGSLRGYYYQGDMGMGYSEPLEAFRKANPQLDLEITTFEDSAGFAERLAQDIQQDTLPDFILCETFSDLNVLRLEQDGMLRDLSSYLESESTFHAEDYFSCAFEGCRRGDVLYLLPLSIGMPLVYTTQEKQKEIGLAIPENYDAPELFLALEEQAQKLAQEEEQGLVCLQLPPFGNPLSVLHALGLSLWDWKTGKVSDLDPETVKAGLEFSLEMYKGTDHAVKQLWGGNIRRASSLTTFATSAAENAAFLYDGGLLYSPKELQLLLSAYEMKGETLISYPIPIAGTWLEDQQYGAELMSYGAVFASSQNPEAAYILLRFLQQRKTGTAYRTMGIPVNRALAKEQFGKYQDSPQAEAILGYFDHGVIKLYETSSLYESLEEALMEYQSGGSVESLMEQVMNRAEVYLNAPLQAQE